MKVINIEFGKKVEYLGEIVLCLGFFDGLHLGHQELINKAKEDGRKVGLLTFDKSPKDLVRNEINPVLTSLNDKIEILEKEEIDYLILVKNDMNFLHMSATKFIENIIIPLGTKKVICGFDYRFGNGREGDFTFLENYRPKVFESVKVNELTFEAKKISTSYIKNLISEGNIEIANKLLGRTYSLKGKVVEGNKIGRTISFPTVNLELDDNYLLPPNGVYASKIIIDGKEYISITNIGNHPSIKESKKIICESHILNYSENAYGKEAKLYLYWYERKEQKFASLDELKNRIEEDKKRIVEYFASLNKKINKIK